MAKVNADQLENASLRLGEAVLDPSCWPELMEAVCRAVGATGALLLQSDVRTPDVPATDSIKGLVDHYFRNGWHLRDLRARRGVPMLLSGVPVVTDDEVATPEEFRRAPFYNEGIFPCGVRWWAGVGFWAGAALWGLSIQRSASEGPFGKQEKQLLAQLSPRLTEVANLSHAVGRVALTSGMNALAEVRSPAIAIDHFGFALGANAATESVFGDDIHIKDRRLLVIDPAGRSAVERLIEQLATPSNGSSFEPIVIRRAERPPVIVRALPVPPAAQSPFLGARAILTFTPLEPKPRPSAALLAEAFGLTPAEARLAAAFAGGATLDAAADELGITRETARNQLKSVFAKTGTHRQSQLVALLARL